MTSQEIKNNLRCCADRYCRGCTLNGKSFCKETLASLAWDLITNIECNSKGVEIDQFKKEEQ